MSGKIKSNRNFMTHAKKPVGKVIGLFACVFLLGGCSGQTNVPEDGHQKEESTPTAVVSCTEVPESTATPVPTATPEPVKWQETVALEEARSGCFVKFGAYEQDNNQANGKEPIEWMVLHVEDGKALLLSKYALDISTYHDIQEPASWGISHLRKWLNSIFYEEAFSDKQQTYIEWTNHWTQLDYLEDEDDELKPGTFDYVFLLEFSELLGGGLFTENENVREWITKDLRNCFDTPEEQIALCTVYASAKSGGNGEVSKCIWWLRTPTGMDGDVYTVAGVNTDGTILEKQMAAGDEYFIRPAIYVDIEQYIKEKKAVEETYFKVADDWESVELSSAKPGTLVTFGAFEQDNNFENGKEPIEWMVLKVADGNALLLSRYGLDARPYHSYEGTNATWKTSHIRQWLNYDFFDIAFDREEQERILYTSTKRFDIRPYSGTGTSDRVFLLGEEDIHPDKGCFTMNYSWNASTMPTEYALAQGIVPDRGKKCAWLLYNTKHMIFHEAYYVDESGVPRYGMSVTDSDVMIRPAIWVSTKDIGINGAEITVPNSYMTFPEISGWLPVTEVGETTALSAADEGDLVVFGRYEQDRSRTDGLEPILWTVVEKKENKVKLISKFSVGQRQYHTREEAVTWESSSLRGWLNGEFLRSSFSGSERDWICEEVTFQYIREGEVSTEITNVTDTIEVYPVLWVDTALVKSFEEQREAVYTTRSAMQGQLVAGGDFVAYLKEDGTLCYLIDHEGYSEFTDFSKKYQTIGVRSVLYSYGNPLTIDTEGTVTYYNARDAYHIYHIYEELGQIQQIAKWAILTKHGRVSDTSGNIYTALDGAVSVAAAKNDIIAGHMADGTVVFSKSPSDLLRNKKLGEWPEKLAQICAGDEFVGLREDGTVIAENVILNYFINTIEQWSDIVAVTAAEETIVGLKADGTVVAVCTHGTDKGQCNVDDWTDIVAVDTNGAVTVGIKADGTVVFSNDFYEK